MLENLDACIFLFYKLLEQKIKSSILSLIGSTTGETVPTMVDIQPMVIEKSAYKIHSDIAAAQNCFSGAITHT